MRRPFRFRNLLLGWLVFATTFVVAEAPLRLQLKEGDRYRYRQSMTAETNVTMPFPQTTKQKLVFEMEERVLSVDPKKDVATVEVRITRIQSETDMGEMGSHRFDSENDLGRRSTENSIYRALLETPYTMTVTGRGEILKVEGASALIEKALEEEGADPLARQQALAMYGDEIAEGSFQAHQPIYPESAAQEWEVTSKLMLPLSGAMPVRTIYRMGGRETIDGREAEKIELESILLEASERKKAQFGPVEVWIQWIELETEGTIHVAPEDGWVLRARTKTEGTMTLELAGSAAMGGGMRTEMTYRAVATTERLPLSTNE